MVSTTSISQLLALALAVVVLSPAEATKPVVNGSGVKFASTNGDYKVGSTIEVSGDQWSVPVTRIYQWQTCTSATSCTAAKGIGASGMRPKYIVAATDVGNFLRVKITAHNFFDKSAVYTSPLTATKITAFQDTTGPLMQFVNGLPDPSASCSTASTFQFLATSNLPVTVTYSFNGGVAKTLTPTNAATGLYTIKLTGIPTGAQKLEVKGTTTGGTKPLTYSWTTVPRFQPVPCATCMWTPSVKNTWDWQLGLPVDTSIVRDVYDIDGLQNNASVVSKIKALKGTDGQPRRVIGYFEAGTLSVWRDDAPTFPADILGGTYSPPYTDERWIDYRQLTLVLPLMKKRLERLVAAGYDAVEYDNIDGWDATQYKTNFPLTEDDAFAFNAAISNLAHSMGLRVSHKNNPDKVVENLPFVDFAVSEECFAYGECDKIKPFIAAGKPVFECEYKAYSATNNVCKTATDMGFHTIYKKTDLTAYGVSCDDVIKKPALRR